jgi:uncharacterized protein (TIGR02284 family)
MNPASLLNELIAVARDGERFYRDAADRVGSPELKGVFRQMSEVRQRLMDELAQQVRARGTQPSDERTLGGAARHLYAGVLATLHPDDEEVYLQRRYEKALESARDGDGQVRALLQRHLLTVRATHERMRALRAQASEA